MDTFVFIASTFISRFPASITPKIVFLFGIVEQFFYIVSGLAINNIIIYSYTSVQRSFTMLVHQEYRTDATSFSE